MPQWFYSFVTYCVFLLAAVWFIVKLTEWKLRRSASRATGPPSLSETLKSNQILQWSVEASEQSKARREEEGKFRSELFTALGRIITSLESLNGKPTEAPEQPKVLSDIADYCLDTSRQLRKLNRQFTGKAYDDVDDQRALEIDAITELIDRYGVSREEAESRVKGSRTYRTGESGRGR